MRGSTSAVRGAPTAGDVRRAACPVCDTPSPDPFLILPNLPVLANETWPTRPSARSAPRGDVELVLCPGCELIHNVVFDPTRVSYSSSYENSLHFSPHFDAYAHALADDLVARHGLRERRVVEIGAGRGDFLALLREAGATDTSGIDPAGGQDDPTIVDHPFEGELPPADLVVARHVLEHVPDPLAFLRQVRDAVPGPTAFYIEVPNASWMLRRGGVWDVIHEHVTYFTPAALSSVLGAAGFRVDRLEPVFEDQFLAAEGRVEADAANAVDAVRDTETPAHADHFRRSVTALVGAWNTTLRRHAAHGDRVALWGAGSKGTTFLNLVPSSGSVAMVVDVNPRKRGSFVAGTGHRIDGPGDIAGKRLDAVIVANPTYEGEIRAMLADQGQYPRVASI